jgi:two-component system, chemotaxis family, chemotaxis protein CheY
MGKTIMIVDDALSIREIMIFTLENAGFTVIPASDGNDALTKLDGREINLLITDLHMPVLDGIELIKKVREMSEYQQLPILFLTTESQQIKKQEAKEAGASGWIIKPFVPVKLLEAVNKVIR